MVRRDMIGPPITEVVGIRRSFAGHVNGFTPREAALIHLAPELFDDLPQVVHIVLDDLSNLR